MLEFKKYGRGKIEKRFTEDQIIKIVKEDVNGNTREICKRHHVMEQIFLRLCNREN